MSGFQLKLYITGQTPKAERAIANLRQICEQEMGDDYALDIIDVLQDPHLAEEAKILATPTLVREQPGPRRCIIGDLSDAEKVLVLLGLHIHKTPGGKDDNE